MPKTALFTEFIENNDWEGETWSCWIPVAGNEEALDTLSAWVKDDDMPVYTIGETCKESEVDILVKHCWGQGGYMDRHNKLTGTLKFPGDKEETLEALYKGGICDMMKAKAKAKPKKGKAKR